ncbi:MAG: DUF1643 domain-containing protein [Miltoncostaeaceae bacterium]
MTLPVTLVVRRHSADGRDSEAVYSRCERYRYCLTRTWDAGGRRLLYIMLNPSKATERANDPTIERCERRARQLGYGAFRVCNLFALRETDPARLRRARRPVGPDNERQLRDAVVWADDVLCAWGVHGVQANQCAQVAGWLAECADRVLVLGLTKDGHPRHPLYLPYTARPVAWAAFTAGRWPGAS